MNKQEITKEELKAILQDLLQEKRIIPKSAKKEFGQLGMAILKEREFGVNTVIQFHNKKVKQIAKRYKIEL